MAAKNSASPKPSRDASEIVLVQINIWRYVAIVLTLTGMGIFIFRVGHLRGIPTVLTIIVGLVVLLIVQILFKGIVGLYGRVDVAAAEVAVTIVTSTKRHHTVLSDLLSSDSPTFESDMKAAVDAAKRLLMDEFVRTFPTGTRLYVDSRLENTEQGQLVVAYTATLDPRSDCEVLTAP